MVVGSSRAMRFSRRREWMDLHIVPTIQSLSNHNESAQPSGQNTKPRAFEKQPYPPSFRLSRNRCPSSVALQDLRRGVQYSVASFPIVLSLCMLSVNQMGMQGELMDCGAFCTSPNVFPSLSPPGVAPTGNPLVELDLPPFSTRTSSGGGFRETRYDGAK